MGKLTNLEANKSHIYFATSGWTRDQSEKICTGSLNLEPWSYPFASLPHVLACLVFDVLILYLIIVVVNNSLQ